MYIKPYVIEKNNAGDVIVITTEKSINRWITGIVNQNNPAQDTIWLIFCNVYNKLSGLPFNYTQLPLPYDKNSLGIPSIFLTMLYCAQPIWFSETNPKLFLSFLQWLESIINGQNISFKWVQAQAWYLLKAVLDQWTQCSPQDKGKYLSEANNAFEFDKLQELLKLHEAEMTPYPNVICGLVPHKDKWDTLRDALITIKNPNPPASETNQLIQAKQRLTWRLGFTDGTDEFSLTSYEQSRKANGDGWTVGKKVTTGRLMREYRDMHFLTDQDIALCRTIHADLDDEYGYSSLDVYFEINALPILAGHPLVFDEDTNMPLKVLLSKPILEVWDRNGTPQVRISPFPNLQNLSPNDISLDQYQIIKTSDDTVTVVHFEPLHLKVAQLITQNGFVIPQTREKEIGEFLEPIIPDFKLSVKSKIEKYITSAETIENIPPDSRVHIYLTLEDDSREYDSVFVLWTKVKPPFKRDREMKRSSEIEMVCKSVPIETSSTKRKTSE